MSCRAWLLLLVGVATICVVVSAAELMVEQSGFLQIPPAALVCLGLLLAMRHVRRPLRLTLTTAELTTLYCAYLVAALVASRGLMEKLVSLLVAPNYFVHPTNHWAENYFPYLPAWSVAFSPTGPAQQFVSRAYYEGLRAGERIPWSLWLRPFGAWAILIALVFGAFLCLAALLRRPWVEHERLAFPLVRLPQAMIDGEPGGAFWRRPLLWLGFALPAFIYSLNSLHAWLPALPTITLQITLNSFFSAPPWSNLSWIPIVFSFAAVGLLYLVPMEMLLSLWAFFLLARLQEAAMSVAGLDLPNMPLFPCRLFIGYQVMGAYLILALGLLRTALPYWWDAVRRRDDPALRHRELLPPRAALIGLAGCLVGLTLWSVALGMSAAWALAEWTVYLLVVCLVMARSVVEGGVLMTETSFRPVDLVAAAAPIHALGHGNLVGMAVLDAAWYRDQRGLVLTGLMDSLKMAGAQGVKRRTLLPSLVVTLVVATACSAAMQVWLAYHVGALRFYSYLSMGNPLWGYEFYTPHFSQSVPPVWQAPVFLGVGLVVAGLLTLLRTMFAGWPLQPLGYALCGSWTMILLWFPCLLTWTLKGLILRYGGRRTYHRLLPFFLGMALGEFSMAVLWTGVSAAGIPAPQFPWP